MMLVMTIIGTFVHDSWIQSMFTMACLFFGGWTNFRPRSRRLSQALSSSEEKHLAPCLFPSAQDIVFVCASRHIIHCILYKLGKLYLEVLAIRNLFWWSCSCSIELLDYELQVATVSEPHIPSAERECHQALANPTQTGTVAQRQRDVRGLQTARTRLVQVGSRRLSSGSHP